jgi:predicted MFS family arabinose efflux permease
MGLRVAFSVGLTLAALLGVLGARQGWRIAFWVSAALAAAAIVASGWLRTAAATANEPGIPWRLVLGLPTAVGAVGAVCQYGAIPFLTTFAVSEWGLSAGGAALLLAVGRVVSIAAKLVTGASSDRVGPYTSARRTGVVLTVTGLAWVLLPGSWPVYALAALFAGTVSSLFPVANVMAVERFGGRGSALGAYRSAQIGVGAVAGLAIGLLGDALGLRPTLAVAVVVPASLVLMCRDPARPATSP